MVKRVLGVTGVLLLVGWLAVSWYAAGLFLSAGIVDYVESEETKILADLRIDRLERQHVEIPVADVVLAGSFFEHPQPRQCAVILLPGIGGNRTQVLPALTFFWDLGCHVLAYDPRGTGASTRTQRTFGLEEKRDNAAVVKWLHRHTGVPVSSIGVWGPSFGAAVSLLTLQETSNLGFVIADSSYHSFAAVAFDTIVLLSNSAVASVLTPGVLAVLEFRTGLDLTAINPAAAVADATTPVLLIHASADPAMHVSHSEKIYAARNSDRVRLQITDWGAGHADSAVVDPHAYRGLIVSFLADFESTRWMVSSSD